MKRPLLLMLSVVLPLAGCGRSGDADTPTVSDAAEAVPVETVGVRVEPLPATITITGTLQAVQRAQVAAKLMGAIEELPVTLGQRVAAGEVLARIAAGEVAARVAQAETRLKTAQRDLEREQGLSEQGASTNETVRNLEDAAAAAAAQLQEAEVMQGYSIVRAPFDGVVTRKHTNAGDFATPGTPLVEVEGLDAFEINAEVPESLAAGLAVDAELPVEVPSARTEFTGRIIELSTAADPRTRTVAAKIAVPDNQEVRSGQFVRVHVPGAARPTVRVPQTAVSVFGQLERVFIVDADNRAAMRLVRTGGRDGGQVEVLAGLQAGDRVIVAPPASLRDGQPVEERR